MYYRFDVDQLGGNTFLRSVSHENLLLTTGAAIRDVIAEPFRFEIEVGEPGYDLDPDYVGPPPDGPPWDPNFFDYYRNVCVMHRKLVDTLRAAGVDNIQSFSATIERPETGEIFSDYYVTNIVGLVSCANLAESISEPFGDFHYFHKLTIDEARTGNMPLFRLAEYPPEILVHERIATKLMNARFRGVRIEPVKESRKP